LELPLKCEMGEGVSFGVQVSASRAEAKKWGRVREIRESGHLAFEYTVAEYQYGKKEGTGLIIR